MKHAIGFGSPHSHIRFYIANRPPIDHYPVMQDLRGLAMGELTHIVKNTSNHWRKAFNVYAKFLFDWYSQQGRQDIPQTWQDYRDLELFQPHAQEALLFSLPQLTANSGTNTFHIIAGKTYANRLALPPLNWLDNYFAVNKAHKLIVSPYPDYRQLSNARIVQLIDIMRSLL